MKEVLYYLFVITAFVAMVAFFVGLVRPWKFRRILGSKATRRHIALYSFVLFMFCGIMFGIFEPESVKQARIEREHQAQIAEQQKLDEEKRQQEEENRRRQEAEETERKEAEEQARRAEEEARKAAEPVAVASVIDGDTIKVHIDDDIESVRLVGIDAPETFNCYGDEAKQALTSILEGQKVRLEKDELQGDRDKYDRLLRFVFLEDGTPVSEKLLRDGLVFEKLFTSKPHKYHDAFVKAQEEAKSAQRGLWSPTTCNGTYSPVPPPAPSPVQSTQTPAPAPKPAPAPAPTPAPSTAYYKNCTVARQAGVTPLYRGQPGYGSHLDRDNDGIACE